MQEIDLIGIGMGPANLGLLAAMMDARSEGLPIPDAIFLERSASFSWHAGAMTSHSKLQVPFLKDLAMQRNPRSRYTFLNFLYQQGRLEAFINLRELFPEREEFAEYLAWVAHEARESIRYSCDVKELFPIRGDAAGVERIGIAVSCDGGTIKQYAARAIVLGIGFAPLMSCASADADSLAQERVLHTSRLQHWLESAPLPVDGKWRFLIAGAGQSGVEAACALLRAFPRAEVSLCTRRHTLRAIDDNPFVNSWYCGSQVAHFHSKPEPMRRAILQDLALTNFGAADRVLLDELLNHQYQGLRKGIPRFTVLAGQEIVPSSITGGHPRCQLRDIVSQEQRESEWNCIVLATGYGIAEPALLRPLDPWLIRNDTGACQLQHDYRLSTNDNMKAALFMHGCAQDQHGPAELSLAPRAVRSGVLLNGILHSLARS